MIRESGVFKLVDGCYNALFGTAPQPPLEILYNRWSWHFMTEIRLDVSR